MKRYALTLLILLVLGALIGLWLLQDPGYALISQGLVSLEMSLWVMAGAWFASLVIALITIDVLLHILGLGEWWAKWRGARRQKNSNKAFQIGFIALETGDAKTAERQLFNAARHSSFAFPAWIAAAHAAAKNNAFDRAEQYFLLAEEQGNRLAVGLARARLLLKYGRFEQAAIQTTRLYDQHRKDTVVLALHLQLLSRLQKWEILVGLLPSLSKPAAENRDDFLIHASSACHEAFQGLVHRTGRLERVHLQKNLQDFWASLPRFLQKETNIQTHYAEALAQSGADDDAAELIRALLDSAWNNTAIALYGRIRSTQPDRAFANALRWKAEHPHNPALLLTLGRLSLQTHQWKAARDYLETSLSLQQNTEARAELLRLLLVSDPEAAAQLQTELLNAQLPNLPLPARP